jgi:hypothetical protein
MFAMEDLSGNLTSAIEFRERDNFFMGGDLKDTVGGSIDDEGAGL